MQSHKITLLGTGLIGMFYTMSIHGKRSRDRVQVVYSRSRENARKFAEDWAVPESTTDLDEAIGHPDTDVVVIGLPNHLHEEAVAKCAAAGKAVLCTKPLGRNAAEARRMLDVVENAGIFAGYLEDLVYTPKTLKSIQAVQDGSIGEVLWARSRETHPGPHSAWFWDIEKAGGGALIDMGCHTVEIVRSFAGKSNRPVEVMCWADTLVHGPSISMKPTRASGCVSANRVSISPMPTPIVRYGVNAMPTESAPAPASTTVPAAAVDQPPGSTGMCWACSASARTGLRVMRAPRRRTAQSSVQTTAQACIPPRSGRDR